MSAVVPDGGTNVRRLSVASDRPVLAIDVGGTKISAGVVEPGGRFIAARRMVTPPELDAEQLWRTLEVLTGELLAEAGFDKPGALSGVGCGCGEPMDCVAGSVSPLGIPAWRDFPLLGRLGELFSGVPVRLRGDGICLTAGEHWRGAGRGTRNMLGVVVSNGIGGGLVLDGGLVSGQTGNAGHVGHVVVDPDGPECRCGGHGCLETIARGPALVAWAQGERPRYSLPQDEQWRPGQRDATARDLADDAGRGHAVAAAAMRRAGHALGVAIASVANLCELEVVAVGGGLAQAGPVLFGPLEEALRGHADISAPTGVRVVPASLGQDAGLIGAAAMILAADRYWPAR